MSMIRGWGSRTPFLPLTLSRSLRVSVSTMNAHSEFFLFFYQGENLKSTLRFGIERNRTFLARGGKSYFLAPLLTPTYHLISFTRVLFLSATFSTLPSAFSKATIAVTF